MDEASPDIIFEQPVNERVRTILRLEHLFAQLAHHQADASPWGLRASLGALIDILSLFSRNDLKGEIGRELSEKHQALAPLREREGVDIAKLDEILTQLETTAALIQDLSSQHTSQALKDSDFLLAIINRSAVPGGTSNIDMPGYHRWLNAPDGIAQRDLATWVERVQPFAQAIDLYLRMLRDSSSWQELELEDGLYVHKDNRKFHLIRVAVPASLEQYPEISAGRQRFTLRLMHQRSALERETPVEAVSRVRLSLCSL